MTRTVYAGTYTAPGGAKGIYALRFDEETGSLETSAVHEGIANPSFLTITDDGRRLYCVHEGEGAVSGYTIGADGLTLIGTRPTQGGSPCHVTLSPDGSLLSVANYMGGSLSVYAIGEDGALSEAMLTQHKGRGPNPQRQEAPHVHSSRFTPSGQYVLVMDLGTDTVSAYFVHKGALSKTPTGVSNAQPGDGPRMSAYSARHNILYVLSEMGNNIGTYACDAQGVPTKWLRAVSTLPEGAPMAGTAADLRLSPDGRFLYASNRGHDSLSVYAVSDTGMLSMVQNVPSGGRTPRGFTISPSGKWLLCGNQDSGDVTVFAINADKGTLSRHGDCAVPTPVCLVFAP